MREKKKLVLWYNSFQELRRDLQAVIGTRANININIAQIENYGGETFLSEPLVQKMLADAKTSFTRCKTVSITSLLQDGQIIIWFTKFAMMFGSMNLFADSRPYLIFLVNFK